jgi:acyl carrier protein
LWKLDAGQHAFLFVPHHLIWDGWSFDLLFDELAAIYGALCNGQPLERAPLAIDYGDFAHWHAQWQSSAEYAAQLVYWKGLFKRLPAPQAIATDRPRGSGRSGRGGIERIRIDQDRADRLRAVARSSGGTLSMLMMAAYTTLIQQMVGGEDVVIGVTVRGRRLPELEPIMGFFNNLLPLPVHVDRQQPFAAWIGSVGGMLAEAFDRQDVPFERLAAEPEVASWARQAGVPYHALISFQDARKRNRNWGGLAHEPIPVMQYTATEDFGLWVTEQPDGIECRLVYDADAFTAETAALVRARLEMILERVLERPAQTLVELTALGDSESALISTWSVVSRGARVLGADGKPVPVGIAGALWQNDQDTGKRARWRCDGTLQTLGVPDAAEATDAAPAAARAAVGGATALSAAEQVLAQVWSELLDVPTVRANDNFFELGGTSLQAMQAATLLEQHFGRPVSARKFVMESLRSLAHSYGATVEADQGALGAAPAVATFGSSEAPRLAHDEAANAAESGAARRKRVGQHKGGLVGRLAGVFGRGRAASTPARPSALPTVARAAPALHGAPLIGAAVAGNAPDPALARATQERGRNSGTSRMRRVKHLQPPVPGAFRGPTIDGEPAWYRLDEKTGRYEQVRP